MREEFLRSVGRIHNASLPHDAKFPILLPKNSHFTNLIIRASHEKVTHNGVRDTLTELRTQFWVPCGRRAVKSAIAKCARCRRIEGRSFQVPPPPPLPESRVADEFAYSRVGVDFAGPIYVRDIYSDKPETHKAYIALFTCATSRGLHLELTPDLTASSFLRAFSRFKARQCNPKLVISDNGKTFTDAKVKAYCLRENFTWKFNVEAAPWWGGFFEQLVRSVKLCLTKSLRNAKLTFEELYTVLVEIEGVLNSRPLTYVFDEMNEPLTPSQLSIGRRILSTSTDTAQRQVQADFAALARRAKFLQQTLNHFWNRWRSEYLTELREHHRVNVQANSRREIRQGDIVIVQEKKQPRQSWRLGKVE